MAAINRKTKYVVEYIAKTAGLKMVQKMQERFNKTISVGGNLIDKLSGRINSFGGSAARSFNNVRTSASLAFGAISAATTRMVGGLRKLKDATLAVAAAFGAVLAKAVSSGMSSAMGVQDMEGKARQVFGTMFIAATQFAEKFSQDTRRSFYDTLNVFTEVGAVAKQFGYTGQALVSMSKNITAMANDMAAYGSTMGKTLTTTRVMNGILAASRNETERLADMGFKISVKEIDAAQGRNRLAKTRNALLVKYKDTLGQANRELFTTTSQLQYMKGAWSDLLTNSQKPFVESVGVLAGRWGDILKNNQLISDLLTKTSATAIRFVTAITNGVERLDKWYKGLSQSGKDLVTNLALGITALATMQVAARGLGLIFGNSLKKLAPMTGIINGLGKGAGSLGAAWKRMNTESLFMVANGQKALGIFGKMGRLLSGGRIAVLGMSASLGVVLGVVAAVAAVMYSVWYWTKNTGSAGYKYVVAPFKETWEIVKGLGNSLNNWLKPLVGAYGQANLIKTVFSLIGATIRGVVMVPLAIMVDMFRTLVKTIQWIVNTKMFKAMAEDAYFFIQGIIKVVGGVKDALSALQSFISGDKSAAVEKWGLALERMLGGVKDFFIFGIKNGFVDIVNYLAFGFGYLLGSLEASIKAWGDLFIDLGAKIGRGFLNMLPAWVRDKISDAPGGGGSPGGGPRNIPQAPDTTPGTGGTPKWGTSGRPEPRGGDSTIVQDIKEVAKNVFDFTGAVFSGNLTEDDVRDIFGKVLQESYLRNEE